MNLLLNGQPLTLDEGASLLDALATLGVTEDSKGVAVALGLDIVRRQEWSKTMLAGGAEIEVVTAAQGG
ncbi:MAG: sulfur carrier protein [Bradymonadia bacterium]|jgi:sulfur carrier protein